MPITTRRTAIKVGDLGWRREEGQKSISLTGEADRRLRSIKNDGGSWFAVAHNTTSGHGQNPDGRKGGGGSWLGDNKSDVLRATSSGSSARKAASAHIAKIPYDLARHIARAWWPL